MLSADTNHARGFLSTRHTSLCHYFLWLTDIWLGINSVSVFPSPLPNCKQALDQEYPPQSGLEYPRRIHRLFLVTVIVANGSKYLESSEENVSPTPLPEDNYLGFTRHQLPGCGYGLDGKSAAPTPRLDQLPGSLASESLKTLPSLGSSHYLFFLRFYLFIF